jgi:syntaxin 1B/2/3
MEYNNPYGSSGGYGGGNPYAQQDSNPYGNGANRYGGGQQNSYGNLSFSFCRPLSSDDVFTIRLGAPEPEMEMSQYNRPTPPSQPQSGGYGGGYGGGGGLPSGPGAMRHGSGLPSGPRAGGPASRPAPTMYGSDNSSGQGHDAQGGGFGGHNNGGSGNSGRSTLEECRAIDQAIEDLESRLTTLQTLHRRVLNDQAPSSQIDTENADIMTAYRGLGARLKKIKSSPESRSPTSAPQVGRVERRLKNAISEYQRIESEFRRQMQDQQARQYRIVRPDASEDEVRAAVEDGGGGQIFQQALLNSDRRGQAQSALGAVRARHEEIQRIERTIVELAQLFQDLDQAVLEQEPMVEMIEQKGDEAQQNIMMANTELDKGIVR